MTLVRAPTPVGFTHRALYGAEPNERPVVDVEFAATDPNGVLLGSYRTGVMVDSGARTTLLNFEVATHLGLDLSDAARHPREKIGGIVPNAGLIVAHAVVKAELCDVWLDVPVCFCLDPVRIKNLLGRRGVFDRFLIGFAHRYRTVLAAV